MFLEIWKHMLSILAGVGRRGEVHEQQRYVLHRDMVIDSIYIHS